MVLVWVLVWIIQTVANKPRMYHVETCPWEKVGLETLRCG